MVSREESRHEKEGCRCAASVVGPLFCSVTNAKFSRSDIPLDSIPVLAPRALCDACRHCSLAFVATATGFTDLLLKCGTRYIVSKGEGLA